jgi:hypothetical protein
MPELRLRASAVVSARQPLTLSAGISEGEATRKRPVPVPVISNRASSLSALPMKANSALCHSGPGTGKAIVSRSRPVAPDERDFDVRRRIAAEPDRADIAASLGYRDAALREALGRAPTATLGCARRRTDRPVHRHRVVAAERAPLAIAAPGGRRAGGRIGVLACRPHRGVELPVVEHLGPERTGHEVADRLDEHAVDVRRDGSLPLGRVDPDATGSLSARRGSEAGRRREEQQRSEDRVARHGSRASIATDLPAG